MTGPFLVDGDEVALEIGRAERDVLASALQLLEHGGDADGRLTYSVHPEDPDADDRYQQLVGDSLNDLRRSDRSRFEVVISGDAVGFEEVEAFMRVVGEARLALASRIGIEEDGWEADAGAAEDPELALLGWLGYLQDAAVHVLTARL